MTDTRSYLINYVGGRQAKRRKEKNTHKCEIKINYMSYLTSGIHLQYVCTSYNLSTLPGNRRHDHVVSRECLHLSSDIVCSSRKYLMPRRGIRLFGYIIPDMKLRWKGLFPTPMYILHTSYLIPHTSYMCLHVMYSTPPPPVLHESCISLQNNPKGPAERKSIVFNLFFLFDRSSPSYRHREAARQVST